MEKEFNKSFELILHAGNSKSKSMEAIAEGRNYDFSLAKEKIEEAKAELILAHKIQTDLIREEINGDEVAMNILMVHAQDHLTNAMMMKEMAEEFIRIYEELKDLKGAIKL